MEASVKRVFRVQSCHARAAASRKSGFLKLLAEKFSSRYERRDESLLKANRFARHPYSRVSRVAEWSGLRGQLKY